MERVAGVILAGGTATRIGGEKALAPFLSGTLLDAVIARAAPQVARLAINIPRDHEEAYRIRFGESYPLLFDSYSPGTGPLAGVMAGLEWLRTLSDVQWLATFPCDTPFLPLDLVAQLMAAARDAPVFARDEKRMHGVCAIWPLACAPQLRAGVESGRLRSLHSALEGLNGETCLIDAGEHAFFNVNTSEDLSSAEALARANPDPAPFKSSAASG